MHPVSTYGASKLGCEAMISAYCHMFELRDAFRFANVVGDRQTHGVTYDFVRKLRADPSRLEILGDGRQSKSYIHVDDVVDAMLLLAELDRPGFEVFNVGTGDYVSVKEIADLTAPRSASRTSSTPSPGARAGGRATSRSCASTTAPRAGVEQPLSSVEALEASIGPHRRDRGREVRA